MPTIKFERVLRNCGHNDNCAPSQRIYDFRVMIDGEHRAELHRIAYGVGYNLQDADNRPINPPLAHYVTGLEIARKADFEPVILELLAAGKVPTLAEMAAKRAEEAAKRDAEHQEKRERARKYQIECNAVALYDVLKKFVRGGVINDSWSDPAGAVLDAVDADIAEALTYVDNERRT